MQCSFRKGIGVAETVQSPHLMRTRIRFVIYAPAVGKNQRLGDSAWSIAWRWGWLYISGRPGSRNGNPRLEEDKPHAYIA